MEKADISFSRPNWLQRLSVHALFFVLYLIPQRGKFFLSRKLASWMLARYPKRRHIALTNLKYCFPELDDAAREQLAMAYAMRYAYVLLDMGSLWFGTPESLRKRTCIEGETEVKNALANGRPVLLLAPHTVGLEHGGFALAGLIPFSAFASEPKSRLSAWVLERLRGRYVDNVLGRDAGMLSVVREMKAGRALYYLPDEDLGNRWPSVFVPYFGREACAVLGSGKLVSCAKAQVVPCITTLDPATGKYTVRLEPALDALESLSPEEICARLRQALETMIRSTPEDYLWSLRIFQTLPCGNRNPDYVLPAKNAAASAQTDIALNS